jgi:hypothetical protein
MGISTDITMDTAVVANYHRIDSVPDIKWEKDGSGTVELAISQYVSYEARKAGASPVNRSFKTFKIDKDLTGILRYVLYKAILPIAPEFKDTQAVQDGELGNMLRLLRYLSPAEMSVMIMAMTDILEMQGIDMETYRPWYDGLKEDTLSTIG